MDKFSYIGNSDIKAIEELYQKYLQNPNSINIEWQNFFKGFDFAYQNFKDFTLQTATTNKAAVTTTSKEFQVINLIQAYRKRGHLFTKTNPVRTRRKYFPTLDIENFGLTKEDLNRPFHAAGEIGLEIATLREIITHLEKTYCHSIGVEFVYMTSPTIIDWLLKKMERSKNTEKLAPKQQLDIFYHLKLAVGFEHFIHTKFLGQKRFSLEGAESLIPALDALIERGAELGIEEFVIGMAHRGRLNVLANILQKPYERLFKEFEGKDYDDSVSLGDVKYHLGYENTITTDKNHEVKIHLMPNPSHLESVAPVTEGFARAILESDYELDYQKLAPVIIHGDAAIAGQGIIYETIQMSQLKGYKTGGTVHIVVNNQVGFTTNYIDARSSTYCTDIGKVTKCPVFHVNGDDPEALIFTVKLAIEYRQQFQGDVLIDLLCYRKYGHNESDEPRFTQPLLYKIIVKHKNTRDLYADLLIQKDVLTREKINKEIDDFNNQLEKKYVLSKKIKKVTIEPFLQEKYNDIRYSRPEDFKDSPNTSVAKKSLLKIADRITTLPDNKTFIRKLHKLMESRKKMIVDNRLNWAMGELLAYGSLVMEGYPVRLSGQDSERGTFSHRHAELVVEDSTEKYYPLKHISKNQASCRVLNSPLNEYATLGFEYGYAFGQPHSLTIWEAQFGDFHNVAQPIIDQYISAAEDKWGLKSGIVLFLPHGYEGQGAEHSSARMERFLTLCANNNMQVCNPTTPANFFHLLRRQLKRDFRKPLIIFTPKSLLRHPLCTSRLEEMSKGSFKEVIDDTFTKPDTVKRIVFCTGKIYYELLQEKKQLSATDIALVRIEQLYPFPIHQIEDILDKYPNALLHLWVQEEPENMGAWKYIHYTMNEVVSLIPVARKASGSPAVGLIELHRVGQKEIIQKVFRNCNCELKLKYCGLQCVEGSARKDILAQHYYLEAGTKYILK